MTTLSSVIEKIDRDLAGAREHHASPRLSPFLTGEQEKLRRYIQVAAGELRFVVPIDDLSEVGPLPEVTPLPNLPAWILGIVSLREEIISVVDINRFLFPEVTHFSQGKRLIILKSGKIKVGVLIDQIIATVSRPDSDRVSAAGTPLAKAAPKVFSQGMESDGVFFHLLEAPIFLGYDRLMNYYEQ